MTRRLTTLVALTLLLALAANCGQAPENSVPEEATGGVQPQTTEDLYGEIRESGYESWAVAPGYETRQAARGPHGDEVQISLSPTAEEALAAAADGWPVGAVIVKDVFRDGNLEQIAAMKKTGEGWYWGEYDPQGEPIAEGLAINECESCHGQAPDGTLAVSLQ